MSPAGEGEPGPDRWRAILLSVLVHVAVAGLLGWGWWRYRVPKPALQQLAIEATVVMDRSTALAPAEPAAPAPAPEPEPAPTLAPTADAPAEPDTKQQAAQQRQEQREAQEREARKRAAVQRAAADERALREREQREQAAAEAKRHEQDVAARKSAEAAKRAAQDKARRESELQAQLAAEERVNAARGSAAEAAWVSLIRDRVTRAWIRPPSARPGVNCELRVTQVPGGVVTRVQIGDCNGDAAVRESIEAAVYRASPFPSPSNPDLFDRNLKFNFRPDE